RDATLQVKGFSDPRQAVAWVAEEICTLFDESASGDTANTWAGLCASDVVVLIPPNLSSDYASFLRAAFLQRNVPFIMQGIAAAHTHVTLDAFALYVAVLGGDDSRQTVLDWLLAPGIIDPDMAPFADACIEIIDALGIYGGTDGTAHAGSYLEGNPAFTWAQGIRRLAMDFAYCTQTLPDVLLPDLNPSLHIQAMAWVSVWRSLFADLQTVRQARLTFAQWRALVMGLFESWLRPEVPYREEDVSTIHAAFDSLWPVDPAGEGDSVHDFGEAEALLKHLVRVVVACGREPALGGIRIRHLHGDVQTARVVFMLGLENENFPSQMPVNSELERFSAYEQDAHAFLKWVLNARDRLYLCGCFLEPEDKQDADAMARDGVLAYEAPYETILAKAAASASVFLRDLMAVTDNLCLGAPLPEPINEERIGVLRGLRQDYHAWTQQNSVSAAAGDTLSASEAPWPGRFDDFPQNIAEALRQAFCSPAARSSHTLPAFSGSNEALPRLPFRALSKFLQQPRDAYRQYILGIPAYQPDGPANLRLKSCEPFEKSGTFTAKQLIPDMMLRLLTSHELSEEKAVEVYETCTCVLRQCGQFPAGVFDEVQRTKDLDWARAILTTLSDLRQTTARRYTFDTRQRTLSRIQQVLQSNLPWGAEPTLLKHEPNLPCQLEGNLPLILDSSDKESIFVFIETAGDEKRIVPQIALATLMLKVSGQTPPNAARFVGKRGSGISLINPHDMFSEEQAAAWLQNLVTLMVTGEHEFSFPRDFNPAKGWQEGFRRAQASSLYRYVGANYLPKQTRAIWRCALQEFQTFFDYLACICPKKQ
ncbi:MAG: exodeoxyribonuclease V subunit gamma, partial [Proteobacteria bacterium]|nr:exodeoxyribonuclease V subunit gamma [Pseudomonadota bacterium]